MAKQHKEEFDASWFVNIDSRLAELAKTLSNSIKELDNSILSDVNNNIKEITEQANLYIDSLDNQMSRSAKAIIANTQHTLYVITDLANTASAQINKKVPKQNKDEFDASWFSDMDSRLTNLVNTTSAQINKEIPKQNKDELNASAQINKKIPKQNKEIYDSSWFSNLNSQLNELSDAIQENIKELDITTLDITSKDIAKIAKNVDTYIGSLDVQMLKSAEHTIATTKYTLGIVTELAKAATAQVTKLLTIESYKGKIKSEIMSIFDTFESFIEKIPGMKIFMPMLNLDTIKQDLSKNITESLKDPTKSGDIINSYMIMFKSIAVAAGRVMIALLANPLLLAVAAVSLLIAKFVQLDKAAEGFRQQTGLTKSILQDITPEIESIAHANRQFGIGLDESYGAAAAIYTKFNNINLVTPKLIESTALLAANFAITEDVSANILQTFISMSGESENIAVGWAGAVKYLSEAGGVAPSAIFKDIAENTEFAHTYLKGSVTELAKAAVNAARLGSSLSLTATIADKLLDFNSSIKDEMLLGAHLGRSISFNRARQLFVDNKIVEAQNEVIAQLKTMGDFEKLNLWTKRAAAETLGISIGQLSTMVNTEKLIKDLGDEKEKQYKDAIDQLNNINEITGEKLLKDAQIQASTTSLMNSLNAIGASLANIILPIIKIIEPIIGFIASIISWISTIIVKSTNSLADFGNAALVVLGVISSIVAGVFLWKFGMLALQSLGIGSSLATMSTSMATAGATGATASLGLWQFAAVILAIGAALWLSQGAIRAVGEAFSSIINSIGTAIPKIIEAVSTGLVKISGVGPGLFVAALGVFALTAALASFGTIGLVGAALGGITAGISNLTGLLNDEELSTDINVNKKYNMELLIDGSNKTNEKLDILIELFKKINFEIYLDGKKIKGGIENLAYQQSIG